MRPRVADSAGNRTFVGTFANSFDRLTLFQHIVGMSTPDTRFPIIVKAGSATVKVYRTTKADGYTSYAVPFYQDGRRRVRFFQDLPTAKREALVIARGIASGEGHAAALPAKARLAYARADQLLEPLDVPVEVAVAEYVEARRHLAPTGAGIVVAAQDYARRHGSIVGHKTVAEAVAELLAQIESEQGNTRGGTRRKDAWLALLRYHLGKLARDLRCEVASLNSATLGPWLVGLKVSERTRCNTRAAVAYLLHWCQSRNYLARDVDPMEGVQNFRKRRVGAVTVIGATELSRLLEHAPDDFVAYLALRAFAGLRNCEAARLDWASIDSKEGWIEIPDQAARQSGKDAGVARMVKIRPVLAAWLAPHARKSGPVCPYASPVTMLARVAKTAKVTMPRNALRHSFISAAVTISNDLNAVSIEAGNSPAIIRAHYWRRMRPKAATAWFNVMPAAGSNVIQLAAGA